jgi:hypothetical protein
MGYEQVTLTVHGFRSTALTGIPDPVSLLDVPMGLDDLPHDVTSRISA